MIVIKKYASNQAKGEGFMIVKRTKSGIYNTKSLYYEEFSEPSEGFITNQASVYNTTRITNQVRGLQ